MGRTPSTDHPRVLCMCQRGVIRSVGLARRLRDKHSINAIPAGWESMHADTLDMLYEWADWIVIVEPYMWEKIPKQFHGKTRLAPIGRDVWPHSGDPDLQKKYAEWLETTFFVAMNS